ncbi:hypothetical protein M9458_007875, partial [Cirrhinus mrigala]
MVPLVLWLLLWDLQWFCPVLLINFYQRTDSEALVHLFQDGESRAESQHHDYQDRAHFFTEEIQRGNFSLRLDNLRTEDEGRYTCTVHSQQ